MIIIWAEKCNKMTKKIKSTKINSIYRNESAMHQNAHNSYDEDEFFQDFAE